MNETNITPSLNAESWDLQFFSDAAVPASKPARNEMPAPLTGVQVIGAGTFGSRVAYELARQVREHEGQHMAAMYLDYPIPAMSELQVRTEPGKTELLPAEPFYPMGLTGDRRDRAKVHPLTRERYDQSNLFRGIAVYDDRKLGVSGEGGGAIPSVAALDIDLHITRLRAFLREHLRWMLGAPVNGQGRDWDAVAGDAAARQQRGNQRWIIPVIAGGSGATGNALEQILPYLVRQTLREMEITNYQLWGVVLGPHAFRGLTPFVFTNYRALLYSLDHMAHHGLRRAFIDGMPLDIGEPPCDHLFLIDDNTLATDERGRVTEAALDDFARRSARAARALLRSNAWDVVAARAVNADDAAPDDGRLRWMTTLSVATAAVDRPALAALATASYQTRLLQALAQRLSQQPE